MTYGACHCLCRLWDHDATVCDGKLDRLLELESIGGELVKVPVCRPCGQAIADAEAVTVDEREEA